MVLMPLAAHAAVTARLVKDIKPVENDSYRNLFVTVDGAIFFVAFRDGTDGLDLWKTDGTESGTILLKTDVNSDLAAIGNEVYFGALDSGNSYLWKCSAADTLPTRMFLLPSGTAAIVSNGGSLFLAETSGDITDLYATDAPPSSTHLVKAGFTQWGDSALAIDGNLFFSANGPSSGDLGLWKSDGTELGTVLLHAFSSHDPEPQQFVVFNNQLLFVAGDRYESIGLWSSDGTPSGTVQISELWAGDWLALLNSSFGVLPPIFLPPVGAELNGAFYFVGNGPDQCGLWQTDRTQLGTSLVASYGTDISSLLPVCIKSGGLLYFCLIEFGGSLGSIYRSDGTPSGTVFVKAIPDGFTWNAIGVDGKLVFEVQPSGAHVHFDLWYSDGTEAGTTMLRTGMYLGKDWSVIGHTIVFSAHTGSSTEIWAVDLPVVPTADFTCHPGMGRPPLEVRFTDTSAPGDAPIDSWLWDFGDGITSEEQNPVHVYASEGIYDVSLTVTTASGTDSKTLLRLVTVSNALPSAGSTAVFLLVGSLLIAATLGINNWLGSTKISV
jgi:ELWxxDGT repeat protein